MIERLLTLITPYNCLTCGQQGSIFCEVCKFDITDEGFGYCLLCGENSDEICANCHKPWLNGGRALGWRENSLEELGNLAKFERSREAARALATMMHTTLPISPAQTIITSVPTHPAHIRQRAYDFVQYLARETARQASLPYFELIERQLNTEQRGHSAEERALQAHASYAVRKRDLSPSLIILIDDVVTTGSTMTAIAQKLYATYETPIYLLAAMRQPKESYLST